MYNITRTFKMSVNLYFIFSNATKKIDFCRYILYVNREKNVQGTTLNLNENEII